MQAIEGPSDTRGSGDEEEKQEQGSVGAPGPAACYEPRASFSSAWNFEQHVESCGKKKKQKLLGWKCQCTQMVYGADAVAEHKAKCRKFRAAAGTNTAVWGMFLRKPPTAAVPAPQGAAGASRGGPARTAAGRAAGRAAAGRAAGRAAAR